MVGNQQVCPPKYPGNKQKIPNGMTAAHQKKLPALEQLLGLVCRVGLGTMFIYAGLAKAIEPVEFLKAIKQYNLLSNPILQTLIAAYLPWFEVFTGLLLVLGIAVRGTGIILLTLLIGFTLLVFRQGLILQKMTDLAFCSIWFDCGCGTGEVNVCSKLVENVMLIVATIILVSGKGTYLALRYHLFNSHAKKFGAHGRIRTCTDCSTTTSK